MLSSLLESSLLGTAAHDEAVPMVSFTRPRSGSPTTVLSPGPLSAWGGRSVSGLSFTSASHQMTGECNLQSIGCTTSLPCQLVGNVHGVPLDGAEDCLSLYQGRRDVEHA